MIKRIKAFTQKMPLVLHPLFIIVFVYFCVIGKSVMIVSYTACALFHEFGHYLCARKLGYKMLQIRLMPYGAELCGELDNFMSVDEIKIALAGPTASLFLSLVVVAMWWINPNFYAYSYGFCLSSLVCGVFNLLPAYPLDGGRVLVAVLSKGVGRRVAVKLARLVTLVFSLVMFGLFVASVFFEFNISFGIVGLMLLCSSFDKNSSGAYIRIFDKKAKSKFVKSGLECVEIMIDGEMRLYKVFRFVKERTFCKFVVVDKNFKKLFCFNESVLSSIDQNYYYESIIKIKQIIDKYQAVR